MGRAYKCDGCGRLCDGLAATLSPTSFGRKARVQAIEVGLGDYAEIAQEKLRVCFSISQVVEGEKLIETVELCPVCQVATVLRAGISLAWKHGIPLHWDAEIQRLCVREDACLFLVEPKDEPEKSKKSRRTKK
ncbi:MAG: hypothetical protein WC291_09510 [Thermodesulfovibrionales bacterium]|jgi:hypothetical protein